MTPRDSRSDSRGRHRRGDPLWRNCAGVLTRLPRPWFNMEIAYLDRGRYARLDLRARGRVPNLAHQAAV